MLLYHNRKRSFTAIVYNHLAWCNDSECSFAYMVQKLGFLFVEEKQFRIGETTVNHLIGFV